MKDILNNYHSVIKDGTISIIVISSFMIKNMEPDDERMFQLRKNITGLSIC